MDERPQPSHAVTCSFCGEPCKPWDKLSDGRYGCERCMRASQVWPALKQPPRTV